jgi:hypothetical protein
MADYGWDPALIQWVKMADPDSTGIVIPVSIINGGTGAVTAVSARINLGVLASNGTITGATSQAQSFGTNGIKADEVAESTVGNGVVVSGTRHYGDSATDPTLPVPAEGDRYYNTVLEMEMRYDGSRTKWLSVEAVSFLFGRNGNTAPGSFYRGVDGLTMSATSGFPALFNGTIVAMGYTRADTDAAIFEIVEGGIVIASLASSAVAGKDTTLNGNFTTGVLGIQNQSGGNTTTDVQGWVRVRWRA